MPTAMKPKDFEKLFELAVSDPKFRKELKQYGFEAIEKRGFTIPMPAATRASFDRTFGKPSTFRAGAKCGVCGVCGLCGLCGEINLGSASAALWALFGLGGTLTTATKR